MIPDIEAVIDPAYVSDLGSLTTAEVRERRAHCQRVENASSFVRRLAQGRLDIVGAELARRRSGETSQPLSELIGRLPEILADGPPGSSPRGGGAMPRPPLELEPDSAVVEALSTRLDEICPMSHVDVLTELGDDALTSMGDQLASFESDVSLERRRLHDTIAALQSEITRRYMTGEENVESLLP